MKALIGILEAIMLLLVIIVEFLLLGDVSGIWGTAKEVGHHVTNGQTDVSKWSEGIGAFFTGIHLTYLIAGKHITGTWFKVVGDISLFIGWFILLKTVGFNKDSYSAVWNWLTGSGNHHPGDLSRTSAVAILTLYTILWAKDRAASLKSSMF